MTAVDMKDWIQNRAEELAIDLTGHEFGDLGPSIQLMLYMKAEEDWVDYYSGLIDHIYEREKERRLRY
ncbi:hypothetical protein LCGC14_2124800 [marine sediment metagenome]|uniref:Uncharacterized protein n=1 Tax=marine sediment metagenome TaxID=412755 RepID=A0A0F9GGA0_9ZZZZ